MNWNILKFLVADDYSKISSKVIYIVLSKVINSISRKSLRIKCYKKNVDQYFANWYEKNLNSYETRTLNKNIYEFLFYYYSFYFNKNYCETYYILEK